MFAADADIPKILAAVRSCFDLEVLPPWTVTKVQETGRASGQDQVPVRWNLMFCAGRTSQAVGSFPNCKNGGPLLFGW